MPHLFDPLALRGVTLKNRIVMSPMCQYSAGPDGVARDWHLIHYATRAIGGVGLVIIEATAVESRGRITQRCLGIWDDRHVDGLSRLVAACHEHGASVGIQLHHTGRKAWREEMGRGPEPAVAPSATPLGPGWAVPHALTLAEIDELVAAYRNAAHRAVAAGFDLVELHGAHGYLVNQFLSPLANHRDDEYGGTLSNRMRLLHRAVDAIRRDWPERAPLLVRLSCSEYAPGGNGIEQTVEIARALQERGVDMVDCSSGGFVEAAYDTYPGYQTAFAERIKRETGIPTAAVGLISSAELAEEIVANGRADLVILGRELLRNPYWPLHAARALRVEVDWPEQYVRAKR